MTSVTDFLDKGYTPEQMLEKLIGHLDLEITDTIPTQFYCNCSKERVEQAVASIGKKDIQEMIDEGKDRIAVKFMTAIHYKILDVNLYGGRL